MTRETLLAMAKECEALVRKHVVRCGCTGVPCAIRMSLEDAAFECRRRAEVLNE